MRIAMLALVTLGYYGILFFLNKRGKAAFKKNATTVLGNTTNLDATEDNLFGGVNNVDADTLSELTTLLDTDDELASNRTNMIDDIEAVAPTPSKKEEIDNQDTPIEESDIDGLMSEIISKP